MFPGASSTGFCKYIQTKITTQFSCFLFSFFSSVYMRILCLIKLRFKLNVRKAEEALDRFDVSLPWIIHLIRFFGLC